MFYRAGINARLNEVLTATTLVNRTSIIALEFLNLKMNGEAVAQSMALLNFTLLYLLHIYRMSSMNNSRGFIRKS